MLGEEKNVLKHCSACSSFHLSVRHSWSSVESDKLAVMSFVYVQYVVFPYMESVMGTAQSHSMCPEFRAGFHVVFAEVGDLVGWTHGLTPKSLALMCARGHWILFSLSQPQTQAHVHRYVLWPGQGNLPKPQQDLPTALAYMS